MLDNWLQKASHTWKEKALMGLLGTGLALSAPKAIWPDIYSKQPSQQPSAPEQNEQNKNTSNKQTRGMRNNNPGNIEKGESWQGMVEGKDDRFVTFENPKYGIRAITKILKTYYNTHKINTLSGMVSRWAPPTENDTNAYISFVSKQSGINPNQALQLDDETLFKVVKSIIKFENAGQCYDDATIRQGVQLAQ